MGSGSNRVWLLVAAIVAGVVVGVVAAVILLAGGDSPSDVAEDYFDGKSRHDCSYIELLSVERTTATNREACDDDPEAYFRDVVSPEGACEGQQVELSDEKEDGDTATVAYVVTSDEPGCADSGTVYLVREDGDWKVDHL